MLPCLNKMFFGIPCPGCGGQRAVLFLLKGEFVKAFFMYPAIYPLLILGGLVLGNAFFNVKHYTKLVSIFGILSVAVILINYSLELAHIFDVL